MPRVHSGPRGPGELQDPLPSDTGSLAGTELKHRFEELSTMGEPICQQCFGWSDDPRHFLPWHWQYVEDALCKRYEDRKEWLWRKTSNNHRR